MEIKKCTRTGKVFTPGDIAIVLKLSTECYRMEDSGIFEPIENGNIKTTEILSKEAFDKFYEILSQMNSAFKPNQE